MIVVAGAAVVFFAPDDPNGSRLEDLRAGDCIEPPPLDATRVRVVDCAESHTAEVYAVGTPDAPVLAANGAAADPEIVRICRTDVPASLLTMLAFAQTHEQGSASYLLSPTGPGRVACVVNSAPRTGSFVAAASAAATTDS